MSCPGVKWLRVQFPFERAWAAEASDAQNTDRALFVVMQVPQKALRGGIRGSFLEPLARFVNIWRESPTFPEKSVKVDF